MTGDGFGGRSWYVAYNYHVGSYSAFTICGPDDKLYGWGNNVSGELGNGFNVSTTAPVPATGMTGVKFFTSGYITAAIRKDSSAWAWGYLTNATGVMFITINPQLMLSNVKFADAGIGHVVFVKYDSTVWAAGQNNAGQLGNGTTTSSALPVQMTNVKNAVRAISLGFGSGNTAVSIILLADGTIKLTGGYPWFSPTDNRIPVIVPGLNNIVDIKGCASAAYALNKTGEVFAFGSETQYGSLGLGLGQGVYMPPTKILFPAGASPIIALAATSDGTSALALDEDGKVYGWGGNFVGQIGDGTYTSRSRPVLIATNVIDISAGETFSYIVKSDKTLWATGQSGWTGSYGSIWMNLPNETRNVFTQIDPSISPMNLCAPKPFGVITVIPTNIDSLCRLDINMKIYPVPTHYKVIIDKKATLCKVTMNIFNTIGQLMLKGKTVNDGHNEIELVNFANGVYFIQFISNGKVSLTRKFLKE